MPIGQNRSFTGLSGKERLNSMRRVGRGRKIAFMTLGIMLIVGSHGGAGKWFQWLLMASLGLLSGYLLWRHVAERSREQFVADFRFPAGLARKLRDTYPHLNEGQAEMVLRELRNFFHVARAARGQMVSMPSQAVDVAWHEFILSTRAYRLFCRQALGRFLDHTPAEHMRSPESAQVGLRRTWLQACRREGINPRKPERLPMLFALDGLLGIPGGFRYAVNCMGPDGTGTTGAYCASDIGCGGGDGGSGDSGDDAGSDGSGDGCGGGGCGGD
jgi:hypothetical protein